MHQIAIIVCCDNEGGIAKNKQIPWLHEEFAKDDLKHFKQTTGSNICVMGRNTYTELLAFKKEKNPDVVIEEILPGRKTYVVTSKPELMTDIEGAQAVKNIRAVIDANDTDYEKAIFILGGERLYIEALANANIIHMSIINNSYDCTTFFPIKYLKEKFTITNGYQINDNIQYVTYTRKIL
jgi:dihydrofolate reductase (trimethoprim resistance protein)